MNSKAWTTCCQSRDGAMRLRPFERVCKRIALCLGVCTIIQVLLVHRLIYSNIGTFGGRPRQYSGPSNYSQLLIVDGETIFSGSVHGLYTLFHFSIFSSSVLFQNLPLMRTARTHKPSSDSHHRTSSKHSKHPAIGPAQSNEVQYILYIRSCRQEYDTSSMQTRAKMLPRIPCTRTLGFSVFPICWCSSNISL